MHPRRARGKREPSRILGGCLNWTDGECRVRGVWRPARRRATLACELWRAIAPDHQHQHRALGGLLVPPGRRRSRSEMSRRSRRVQAPAPARRTSGPPGVQPGTKPSVSAPFAPEALLQRTLWDGNRTRLTGSPHWGGMQRSVHTLGVAGNGLEIGARRLIRFRPCLFPVAQRAERDLVARRELLLREL